MSDSNREHADVAYKLYHDTHNGRTRHPRASYGDYLENNDCVIRCYTDTALYLLERLHVGRRGLITRPPVVPFDLQLLDFLSNTLQFWGSKGEVDK